MGLGQFGSLQVPLALAANEYLGRLFPCVLPLFIPNFQQCDHLRLNSDAKCHYWVKEIMCKL